MADQLSYPVPQEVSLLPLWRLLAQCGQQAERLLAQHVEPMGLTPSQFDVLATLGDLPEGMNFKALSQQSLITGGTLTPVLGRMEAKGLVRRRKSPADSRQSIVSLTPEGQALYEASFLPWVERARAHLAALSAEEHAELVRLMGRLREALG